MSLNRLNRGLLATDGQREYMSDIEYLSSHGLIDEDRLVEDNSEFINEAQSIIKAKSDETKNEETTPTIEDVKKIE